ncbi:YbaY family lipoprotein [Photobacterium leiognathi]|uniref:YbaY family lipoprotein n=1 Tax=Photobacterium leiognathi TaxID=553611 RepID=UPI0029829477|nr:YbaY family lipoprotein [Photobacterium leiognathi]
MKNSFAWFGLLLAVLAITACTNLLPTDSDVGTLKGTVGYRERIVLPDNARIVVSLVETNAQDNNSSKVISQHSFLAEGAQPPVEFTLQYMKSKILPDTSYRVIATIEVDDKLLFSNQSTKALNIDPLTTTRVDIPLVKA